MGEITGVLSTLHSYFYVQIFNQLLKNTNKSMQNKKSKAFLENFRKSICF